jgi:hypothetical protein
LKPKANPFLKIKKDLLQIPKMIDEMYQMEWWLIFVFWCVLLLAKVLLFHLEQKIIMDLINNKTQHGHSLRWINHQGGIRA